jgi:acyl carrier protein
MTGRKLDAKREPTLSETLNTVEQRIIELLLIYLEPVWAANPAGRTEITGNTNLVSDLTLDSFQVMEFLMEIEDEYDVAIDMNALSDVHTISDLSQVVLPLLED